MVKMICFSLTIINRELGKHSAFWDNDDNLGKLGSLLKEKYNVLVAQMLYWCGLWKCHKNNSIKKKMHNCTNCVFKNFVQIQNFM